MTWKTIIFLLILVTMISLLFVSKSKRLTPLKSNFDYYPPHQSINTLVILLHGGSWMAGDTGQLYDVGKYFAKQGMSVVNLNYRLAPEWQYDSPLQDIASVLRQVGTDPTAFGLVKNYKTVVMGFSAGGHIATQFCLSEAKYEVRQVDMCVSLAGIYDLQRIVDDLDGPLLKPAVIQFLGKSSPKDASPIYQVSDDETTKFLLIRGDADLVVAPEQMDTFVTTLKAKNVHVDARVIPRIDHLGIFGTIPENDPIAQIILKFINP